MNNSEIYKIRYYPECKFGGYTDIDGTIVFYQRIASLIDQSSIVLNLGSGTEYKTKIADPVPVRKDLRILRGRVKRVIGIDIDPEAQHNPLNDEFRLIEHPRWPVDDQSIDVCVSDFVLEHVEDPATFFSESWRVLKPGGYMCLRTPNLWHYVSLAARLIPDRLHLKILKKVQPSRDGNYPTYYRCNTARRVRKMLEKHGFDHCVYTHESNPSYLSFSHLAYRLGVFYQRHAPPLFRVNIFAFAQKPSP
jgi:SAM-dependent methyltransferase